MSLQNETKGKPFTGVSGAVGGTGGSHGAAGFTGGGMKAQDCADKDPPGPRSVCSVLPTWHGRGWQNPDGWPLVGAGVLFRPFPSTWTAPLGSLCPPSARPLPLPPTCPACSANLLLFSALSVLPPISHHLTPLNQLQASSGPRVLTEVQMESKEAKAGSSSAGLLGLGFCALRLPQAWAPGPSAPSPPTLAQ